MKEKDKNCIEKVLSLNKIKVLVLFTTIVLFCITLLFLNQENTIIFKLTTLTLIIVLIFLSIYIIIKFKIILASITTFIILFVIYLLRTADLIGELIEQFRLLFTVIILPILNLKIELNLKKIKFYLKNVNNRIDLNYIEVLAQANKIYNNVLYFAFIVDILVTSSIVNIYHNDICNKLLYKCDAIQDNIPIFENIFFCCLFIIIFSIIFILLILIVNLIFKNEYIFSVKYQSILSSKNKKINKLMKKYIIY